jgi:hypothetical protein
MRSIGLRICKAPVSNLWFENDSEVPFNLPEITIALQNVGCDFLVTKVLPSEFYIAC